MSTNSGKLWGGRFSSGPSAAMDALSRSVHFDWRLAPYDLSASIAHSEILLAAGLLTSQEQEMIANSLQTMREEVLSGALLPNSEDEDVHGALERILVHRLGDLGGKLRAGRSRNDQVATDFKMYLRANARHVVGEILELIDALIALSEKHADSPSPGFTHLQHAQPVTLGHELAKHAHALVRDLDRIQSWDKRTAISPLGSGALSGSTLDLDPIRVAQTLGFDDSAANSIDAVSDRDFAAELAFILALVGVHLSRIGEEWTLFATREFGWVELSDEFSTGSSIMPQKKNPDVAELARGKAGRLIGHVTSLLTTMKGLAFAYNRDLQEDKEPLFDSIDTLMVLLPAVTGMVATSKFNTAKIAESAPEGFSLATEIADWLVREGVPFRSAHEVAGACVKFCESSGKELSELSSSELASIDKRLTPEVCNVLTVEGALKGRLKKGGTAPEAVRQQLAALRERVQPIRIWSEINVAPFQVR